MNCPISNLFSFLENDVEKQQDKGKEEEEKLLEGQHLLISYFCFTWFFCVKHRLNVFSWTCAWKVDQDFPSIHWTFDLTVHEMLYFLLVSLVCPIITCKWMHVMLIYWIQGLAPICYTHTYMGWVYYEFLSYKKGHNDYKRKTLDIAFIILSGLDFFIQ